MTKIVQSDADERPLWRRIVDFPLTALVISVALFVAASEAEVMVARLGIPSSITNAGVAIRSGLAIIFVFALYKVVIRKLGEHPRDDLPLAKAPKQLGQGLLAGFVLFSAIVGTAAAVGVYHITGRGSSRDLVQILVEVSIFAGFMEEMLFRGILFRWIEELAGSWAAVLVTSALFGLAHILNPNATWFSSFAIAVEAGVLLSAAYMVTRSLWVPIGLHAAWNFTQGYIFGVPVSGMAEQGLVQAKLSGSDLLSGGEFGLEASLIAVVIATASGLWLLSVAVRRGLVVQPMWMRPRRAAIAA